MAGKCCFYCPFGLRREDLNHLWVRTVNPGISQQIVYVLLFLSLDIIRKYLYLMLSLKKTGDVIETISTERQTVGREGAHKHRVLGLGTDVGQVSL